jgi:predicted permease
MAWLSEIGRRLSYLFRRGRWENDLAEEMRLHADLRTAAEIEAGRTAREASAVAHRKFGNAGRIREESRAAWGWNFFGTLSQDIRYGIRTLAAHPGFTAAAVLSLALGIGANTAIFGILNAVMLRSLPVEDPRQLVRVELGNPSFTNPLWEAIRDHQQAFSSALAYSPDRFNLAAGGESQMANGVWVSGEYFHTLGVPAIRGRVFTKEDDFHGGGRSGPVAVISYSFWMSHFGGDSNVLGKTVRLNRHPFEIVGITPPWFRGLEVDRSYDVAIPIGCEPLLHTDESALNHRSWWWLRIVGRVKPGETPQRAEAQMNSIAPEIAKMTLPDWDPENQKRYLKRKFALKPGGGFSMTGSQYKRALFTLMTVVGLVLLIACVNIANLLLARAAAREREISVRLAIGASRWRIVRQLMTESLMLSGAGAAGGLLFAWWGSSLLVRLLSTDRNELQLDVTPDLNVLAFTAGVAVFTGILFGIVPALRATGVGTGPALKENARGSIAGSSRFNLGKALVTVQIALSLALLAGAGLFLGTFRNLLTVDAGFNWHNVLLVNAAIQPEAVKKEVRAQLFDTVLTRLRAIPGVESAASMMMTPISGMTWNNNVDPEGRHSKPDDEETLVYLNRVSTGYFHTMGTPILVGRDFSVTDNLGSPKVMIVGETTARSYWGSDNPIGKTVTMGTRDPAKPDSFRVIGVVKDIKYEELSEKTLKTGFMPALQDPEPSERITFEIRSAGPDGALKAAIRSAIGDVNKDISLEFRSLEKTVDDSLLQARLVALLSGFFGFLALMLAMLGLYGVISYSAARRRGEIGIRMALGAAQDSVIWLILRDVMLMLCAGATLGLAASLAAGRLVASLLFAVKPADPVTLGSAFLLLAAGAVTAGYLPARRASRMDPMAALRNE